MPGFTALVWVFLCWWHCQETQANLSALPSRPRCDVKQERSSTAFWKDSLETCRNAGILKLQFIGEWGLALADSLSCVSFEFVLYIL